MTPMMNMYETIRSNLHFNKFAVGELLFVEYKCPIEQEAAGVWTPMDYFVHVLSGRKTWRTTEGTWTLEKGQTLFFKKGAAVLYQDFKDDFCVLVFFVSDDFIRDVVREVCGQLSGEHGGDALHKTAIIVNGDVTLAGYFQSMLAYFTGDGKTGGNIVNAQTQGIDREHIVGTQQSRARGLFSIAPQKRCASVVANHGGEFLLQPRAGRFREIIPSQSVHLQTRLPQVLQPVARQVAIAKATGILSRAAKKSRAERFASRLGLRVRRPLAFQPGVQGKFGVSPANYRKECSGPAPL